MFWIKLFSNLRDVFQTIFFITISIITLLTYIKAKKTLLQPIKTEVFKEQIKIFAVLLEQLSGRSEISLREDYDFDKVFYANAFAMYDSYAYIFFDIEVDLEKRLYSSKECPIKVFKEESLALANEPYRTEENNVPTHPNDPRTRAAIWGKYKYEPIHIPKKFTEMEERLTKLSSSPLVPRELSKLLDQYQSIARKNLFLVGQVLTESAKKMIDHYPNVESLKKSSYGWINEIYIDKFESLKPQADKISEYLRSYFTSDNLLE